MMFNDKLLIMALKSDINLTLEESYTSAGAAWKLENEDTFRMNMDSYMDVNKTIVPNICMTMLQQKGDRNWDDNIQKKIEYGCEVLKKYCDWKWGARTKLDLMTSKQMFLTFNQLSDSAYRMTSRAIHVWGPTSWCQLLNVIFIIRI
ncbi:unnamed protein product [Schistosoma rodhaini]|uniref:DUF659 domain-containing protein n=1 Tax=Schistosoma rodhaini TaxID=6188 RepID=A0AA85FSP7_9TREM|nr:unnamed protein product [Schistosoma rodhaini]